MIKVSVLYPGGPNASFDMDYYCSKHVPMVQRLLGSACKGVAVEAGLSGIEPGSSPSYVAMGHLYFDSVADFQSSFGANFAEIVADVPNYTSIQPILQISQVKI